MGTHRGVAVYDKVCYGKQYINAHIRPQTISPPRQYETLSVAISQAKVPSEDTKYAIPSRNATLKLTLKSKRVKAKIKGTLIQFLWK